MKVPLECGWEFGGFGTRPDGCIWNGMGDREYMSQILTISLYVPKNLWTRFWTILEGEMFLAEWIKDLGCLGKTPWDILSKLETSIVLSFSEQVKMKKWWLDMSHILVEILAERRKNITEKVWLTNHACFMEILVSNWMNEYARTYSYYIKVKTERSRYKAKK